MAFKNCNQQEDQGALLKALNIFSYGKKLVNLEENIKIVNSQQHIKNEIKHSN